MSLTIRRLRSFIVVAERLSYRRAAEHLAISQPALTSHIKEIETYLGISLFQRTTRQVTLTADGAAFLAVTKHAVEELDSAVENVKQRVASQRGRVIVGCTPAVAGSLLPKALGDLRARHPEIEVQIYDDRPEILYRLVLTAEVDFAVGPPPQPLGELAFHKFAKDSFAAICPIAHPLLRAHAVTLQDLVPYPLITMREGLSMRHELDRIFTEQGYVLRPVLEVFDRHTVLALVAGGLGIGLLPRLLCPAESKELRAITISAPKVTRAIGVIVRRGTKLTAAASRLIEMFKAQATKVHSALY